MAQTYGMKLATEVEAVRSFNRFYTKQIGALREGLLGSSFSLTQVRVLYELAHRKQCTASELGRELGLDPGYLSRLLRHFAGRRLIEKTTSAKDGRQSLLRLTAAGQQVFDRLNTRQNEEVIDLLQKLSPAQQQQLVKSLRTAQQMLDPDQLAKNGNSYILRSYHPGDLGWVVHRHGVLYSGEERYDERFEGLVAKIIGEFVENLDPRRERCWIAEKNGEVAGFVFLVKKSGTVCKLRLLLVEPWARGMGIGRRLISECVRFARQVGFKKMMLWTQSDLIPARRLYQEAGFRLVEKEPHSSWGRDNLVSETWELEL
jgi:DNA-binding MarR family transcriptional regulator/N-acetylglutamate synthase-like GNAT family acetyltransferase